jgi:hypothetical protein
MRTPSRVGGAIARAEAGATFTCTAPDARQTIIPVFNIQRNWSDEDDQGVFCLRSIRKSRARRNQIREFANERNSRIKGGQILDGVIDSAWEINDPKK